jgi:hypothetical protein
MLALHDRSVISGADMPQVNPTVGTWSEHFKPHRKDFLKEVLANGLEVQVRQAR